MQSGARHGLMCSLWMVIAVASGCTETTNNVTQQQVVVVGGQANAAVYPPGSILACSLEPKLKSTSGVQKILMTFQNQTGATVKLYWLTYEGQRKQFGTIDAGLTRQQVTFITHPWVIADENDKCLEIVMPGRGTQAVVLRNRPDQPTTKPSAPN